MAGDRALCVTWHDAVILIKNAPTVDAERVIRCKDCEYFDVKWQEDKFGFLKYENVCNLRGRDFIVDVNDYCSWAEEKEK